MANANATTSYLDPPQLIGRPNADGTISITPLELKKLNDYNYAVAKMIQGGLNLANLNKETNDVFTGMVTFTDLETGGSTTINGSNITTGTISADRVTGGTLEGVTIVSDNDGEIVKLDNGAILFKNGTTTLGQILPSPTLGIFMEAASGKWLYLSGDVQVGMYDSVAINGSTISATSDSTIILVAGTNMSLNADGTVYIGTSASHSGNVDIGRAGGTVHLVGDVYINGVLLT